MRYITKATFAKYALPVIVIASFSLIGYNSTRSLFAQTPAPNGIGAATVQNQYSIGQTITILLYNTTRSDVYILNKCPNEPLTVYRKKQGSWIQIHAATDPAKCAGEPRDYLLPLGRTTPIDYRFWPTLFNQPGTYRIVVPIESYASGPTVSFTVLP